MVEHPAQRLTLVPVDIWAQLDDLAACCHAKRSALSDIAYCGGGLADTVTGGIAVVHGNAKPLVFHHNTGDVSEFIGELGGRMFEHRDACRRLAILVMGAVGSGPLKTMTA